MIKIQTTHELRKLIKVINHSLMAKGLELDFLFGHEMKSHEYKPADAALILKRYHLIKDCHQYRADPNDPMDMNLTIEWEQDMLTSDDLHPELLVASWTQFVRLFTFSQFDALHIAVSLSLQEQLIAAAMEAEREAREDIQLKMQIQQEIIFQTLGLKLS